MSQLQNLKPYHPSLKRLVFGGLGSGVGILGVVFAAALYVVEVITRPKKLGRFGLYIFSPYELNIPAEAVTFAPLNGDYQVSGWYVPCEGATTTILLCPGFRTPMSNILGMVAHLWKAGHNVLAFEYYGHGVEVGSPITLGYREINDFLGAVAYAKERAPHTRLGVIAYSMGASVAIMASARCPDIEALVADSAFATHFSAVDYNFRRVFRIPSAPFAWVADQLLWWRAGYHFHQVEPLRDIASIAPRPILIIQGGKDSIVDPRDASLLYAAAQEPKELWFLPNADHCGAYFEDRPTYVKKVTDFFDLHLKNIRHLQLVEPLPQEEAQLNPGQNTAQDLPEAS